MLTAFRSHLRRIQSNAQSRFECIANHSRSPVPANGPSANPFSSLRSAGDCLAWEICAEIYAAQGFLEREMDAFADLFRARTSRKEDAKSTSAAVSRAHACSRIPKLTRSPPTAVRKSKEPPPLFVRTLSFGSTFDTDTSSCDSAASFFISRSGRNSFDTYVNDEEFRQSEAEESGFDFAELHTNKDPRQGVQLEKEDATANKQARRKGTQM